MKQVIAVLCPMGMEFEAVEKALGVMGEVLETGFEEKRFSLDNKNIILARTGIGKTLSAAKAQKIISMYAPTHLFVCGVAGAIKEDLALFDVIIPNRVIHGDTAFGKPSLTGVTDSDFDVFRGKLGFEKDGFYPDCSVAQGYHAGTLVTLDSFADEEKKIFLETQFGAELVDMESACIVQIATLNETPVTVIRSISDTRKGHASFDENAPEACRVVAKALISILEKI